MSDVVINIAKGAAASYSRLAAAGTFSLVVVPINASGIVPDSTMKTYATLAALLGGGSTEQTTMGRKAITSGITVSVDNANNWVTADFPDVTWTSASGAATAALVVCYVPTSGAADSAIIPLTKHDFAATPAGGNITAQVNASGFYKAA